MRSSSRYPVRITRSLRIPMWVYETFHLVNVAFLISVTNPHVGL